jgi:hypothetical protein
MSLADRLRLESWEHSYTQELPRDTFYASGHLSQSVILIPARSLGVVRPNASSSPIGTAQLVEELVSAMRWVEGARK